MAATKDPKKKHSRRGPQPRKPSADAAPAPVATPETGAATAATPAAITPPKVTGGQVADRIRSIAHRSESIDARRALRRLARLIAARPKGVHRITLLETEIGDCLERAEAASRGRCEPWLELEAATWALAWLARSRRAGGSAGGLLEQLVRRGRVAVTALQGRDTQPALFVITLASLFPDIEACAELGDHAVRAVEEEIDRLVSETGSLRISGSVAVLERVGRWALCREALAGKKWAAATDERFVASVGAALRLLGDQGRMLVGIGRLPRFFSAPLLEAARSRGVDTRLRRTARCLETGDVPAKRLLPRDLHDGAAAVAILRSGWGTGSLRVAVEYRDATPRIEIAAGDRLLVDGPWHWSLTCGGETLEAEGPWTFSGLESDRKSTFFEIAAPLTGGLRLERTVVVLPTERIVVVADAITRTAEPRVAGELRLTSRLTLAPGLEAEQAEETRESFLFDTGMRAMALPLGLGEWKGSGGGDFTAGPAGLSLEQRGVGRLHAAVWLDCDPRRAGRPVTWRQLTVADTRQNLPRSMAAGYRVQVGHDQWLLYRALDEPRNRTLLGCNVSCEFLLGRIGRSGVVKRLVEIQ